MSSVTSEMDPLSQSTELLLEKYKRQLNHRLQELLRTEETFVEKNLREIVEGYYSIMEETKISDEGRVKIPADLLGGKDRIIFGNIRDIYDLHKK